jgi:hypothetical protein
MHIITVLIQFSESQGLIYSYYIAIWGTLGATPDHDNRKLGLGLNCDCEQKTLN